MCESCDLGKKFSWAQGNGEEGKVRNLKGKGVGGGEYWILFLKAVYFHINMTLRYVNIILLLVIVGIEFEMFKANTVEGFNLQTRQTRAF